MPGEMRFIQRSAVPLVPVAVWSIQPSAAPPVAEELASGRLTASLRRSESVYRSSGLAARPHCGRARLPFSAQCAHTKTARWSPHLKTSFVRPSHTKHLS